MPIKRRTTENQPSQSNRWTHEIVGRQFTAGIRVVDRKVTDAEPQLHWTLGHRYDKIVEISNSRGDEVQPIVKEPKR